MASAISSPTMLTTNSRVARMFAIVSFGGLRHTGPNPTTGGSAQNALKKLNGARLSTPAADIVETNAIGRGTTEPISTRYIVCAGIVDGSMIMKSLAGLKGPPHAHGTTLQGRLNDSPRIDASSSSTTCTIGRLSPAARAAA